MTFSSNERFTCDFCFARKTEKRESTAQAGYLPQGWHALQVSFGSASLNSATLYARRTLHMCKTCDSNGDRKAGMLQELLERVRFDGGV